MIDKKEIVARLRRLSGASKAELRGFVSQVHGVYEAKIVRWVDLGDGKVNFWVAVAMPVSMADYTGHMFPCLSATVDDKDQLVLRGVLSAEYFTLTFVPGEKVKRHPGKDAFVQMFKDFAEIAKERLITLPEDVPPPRDDTPPYDPKYVFV
jgi:hypothetical protein